MDPHFTYRFKNSDFLHWIKGQFDIANKNGSVIRNMGKIHNLFPLSGPSISPSFWEDHPEKLDLLTQLTYPYGEEILISVIKHYNKNEYSALHQDDPDILGVGKKYKSLWTNSILIDKSDDVKGGDVVIAGDGFERDFEHIKSRLITLNHEEIGNSIVWDSQAVHGISRIEKGYRTALIVVKGKERQNG